MPLLNSYNGPKARRAILVRYPELRGVIDTVNAIVMAHDAGRLDATTKQRAATICQAFRLAVGYLQDMEGVGLPVDQHIALLRIKSNLRDAALIMPWPFTPIATVNDKRSSIILTGAAEGALSRLIGYDPIRDYAYDVSLPRYAGVLANTAAILADLTALADGASLQVI